MPRGRAATSHFSISQLEALIHSKRSKIAKWEKARAKLEKRLSALVSRIISAGGSVGDGIRAAVSGRKPGRPRKRARNAISLPDAIAHALSSHGKPMKVPEIVKAVEDAGYKSHSANFRGIVNQALIKDKRFHATERGIYGLKK